MKSFWGKTLVRILFFHATIFLLVRYFPQKAECTLFSYEKTIFFY
jgi:hypothetical protein